MVTARYLTEKFVEPLREKRRAEARKKGKVEGMRTAHRKWSDWNNRRLEAREKGARFDEAPPSSSIERDKTASHREIYSRGYSDGYSQGIIYGIRKDWYRRRMEAEAKGVPFEEPPPTP